MLPHLILIVLQVLGARYGAPIVKGHIPPLGRPGGYDIDIFVLAIIIAVIVFVVGFVGSIVLKGVRTPGAGALTLAVVLALIGAALSMVPVVTETVGRAGLPLDRLWWPLLGAMIGYFIKR